MNITCVNKDGANELTGPQSIESAILVGRNDWRSIGRSDKFMPRESTRGVPPGRSSRHARTVGEGSTQWYSWRFEFE